MNIVIIGAGNVGSALAKTLDKSGFTILRIISRSGVRARKLAAQIGCEYGNKPVIPDKTDLLILAVNDDSIISLAEEIQIPDAAIIAHTAGSIGSDVFTDRFLNYGVFYPLQTFSTGRKYDFSKIPVFIEGSNDHTQKLLRTVATNISEDVFYMNSENRKYLHLAAVFVCNFVNHMYCIGGDIADRSDMDFNALIPLITETLNKAVEIGPVKSQTGPAVRNDQKTIEKHLDLLSFSPDYRDIYKIITQSINKMHIKTSHE